MQDRTGHAVAALGLLTLAVPPPLVSASPGDALDACGVENPMVYVRSSLQRVEDGEELTTVLDTLACIAESKARSSVASASVKALFHLAGNDGLIRKYLLEIVDSGDNLGRNKAGPPLALVANGDVRNELLTQAKARWKRSADFSGQSVALVELGDLAYLGWLEEHVLTTALDGRLRSHYEAEAAKIRIQHNPEALLAQIESATPEFHRYWLIQHALRLGIARERLQTALVTYVHNLGEDEGRAVARMGVSKLCEDNDLLPQAELAKLKSRTRTIIGDGRSGVWWAVAADIRWREFYSYSAKNDSSKREVKP